MNDPIPPPYIEGDISNEDGDDVQTAVVIRPPTMEEKHPFAVRLGWVALLVTMAMLILGIYFERHLSKTNDDLVTQSHQRDEDQWIRCDAGTKARLITINNARAEKTLFTYLQIQIQNSITAATLTAADHTQTEAARVAARQRIKDNRTFLLKIPHVVVPKPYPVCGSEPFPNLHRK